MIEGMLSNHEFLSQLSALFFALRQKNHGSIFLTQKLLTYGNNDDYAPLPLLVRASNGKSKAQRSDKVKLATRVEADAAESFFASYADVCKVGMGALKKRDRSRAREKLKKKKKFLQQQQQQQHEDGAVV